MLKITNVSLEIQQQTILNNITCNFEQKKMYGLIGHNGSGKSSLIKLMAGELVKSHGSVCINDKNIEKITAKELAKTLAYLPQTLPDAATFTVEELVMLGRYPWQKWLQKPSKEDKKIVEESMQQTQIHNKADQTVATLSGGERARAWLAMCLAQRTDFLLLDEPLASLDIVYQVEILTLIKKIIKEQGVGVALVIHDINLAAQYCDEFIALKNGEISHTGTVREMMVAETLHDIFGVTLHLLDHPTKSNKVALV